MPTGYQADLSINTEDVEQDVLEEILDAYPLAEKAALTAVAEDLVGRMKREVNTNTSRLQGTIRAVEGRDGIMSVMAGGQKGVDYTLAVLEGSRPHAPGSPDPAQNRSLSRWADRNNYPGGFESIYWSIYHYGTEAHDFVTEPTQETRARSDGIMTQVFRKRGIL